jgi:putative DNA methylase
MATMKEQLAQDLAKAVGAGRAVAMETVDFNDPNRPKTCLEVDFPILPVNQVAIIEGNASKPIYQMSKWWARRRSSIFRSMLIAAATKAPEDASYAAKLVWDNYYANHQKKGAFKNLKVADIFMGGGTTLVEGSRLGMQMFGNDLNPVAWFVVKQEFAKVHLDEVRRLLREIEAEVKPQIIPYFYCDGPQGEKGKWTYIPTGRVMDSDFDPLSLTREERPNYSYDGPEAIYTFWAKHGPCQTTGCGHRTPIMISPVMAIKTLGVRYWEHTCAQCGTTFHAEQNEARMSPDVPLFVVPGEFPYSILDSNYSAVCPHCGHSALVKPVKGKLKKVDLTLLVHPEWLAGSPNVDHDGLPLGGTPQDGLAANVRWNNERAARIRFLEVRGVLPEKVICPETLANFYTDVRGGTAVLKTKKSKLTGELETDGNGQPVRTPERSTFTCQMDGSANDILKSVYATRKSAPSAAYAQQCYSSRLNESGNPYGGRFFAPFDQTAAAQFNASLKEWESRKNADLTGYWPAGSKIPRGHEAHQRRPLDQHGYSDWTDMFNARQLLVLSQLLKAITTVGDFDWPVREYVLAAFQQYLRNENLFTIWNLGADKLEPMFSNNNFHPKTTTVENCVFPKLGRGNWSSCIEGLIEGREWAANPWEIVSVQELSSTHPNIILKGSGKSEKTIVGDQLLQAEVSHTSSTDLSYLDSQSMDLIITDPPFGNLIQYSELADFFYVWLRLPLAVVYPTIFGAPYSPNTLEAVANPFREPDNPNSFYQRVLTECWREAERALKVSGILAFTFHHSEDEPWVAVLESLFDAGFYLEATYPIRSDETKGENAQFGAQKIEYDIIHVCRKRTEEPTAVSWGRMRREVLADVRHLQATLENHAKQGLPPADLQVIKRGKALEYFSRHYGKVYVDEGRAITVKDALVGINQLIDEDRSKTNEPPPVNAEPITRQFLRIFDGKTEIPRDQMHKFLRGSGITPGEFEQRGWCSEKSKIFTQINPMSFAQEWHGRHRRRLTSDLDQSLVLVGSCFDNSGINAADTLNNENFKPHPALKPLLDWLSKRGATQPTRNAASRALTIYNGWATTHEQQVRQMSLFLDEA